MLEYFLPKGENIYMKKLKYKLYYERIKKVKIVFYKDSLVDSGTDGDVYYYKDGCIKIYRNIMPDYSISVIKTIKNISDPNLYCIRNLYYDSKNSVSNVKAYDMDYYRDEKINILTMPMDYSLDNFNDLCKLAEKISLYKIEINDLHEKNVIMQRNRFIIIDADRWFKRETCDCDFLFAENYKAVVHLLMRLYYRELVNLGKIEPLDYNIYDKVLGNLERIKAREIAQELSGYKYPIDYIEAKVKKLR